ncbi:hypothetical protein [Planomonospora parontospora]|uniref:hypothetical protein n=1 Tax=Planomonospora parontospora TaxID=58119 RepID=UPI00167011AF|nr:hypothetical protein [Planomonospora parontospora]GGL56575.1 hypothetical protein GCM10014719_67510 [Planomonospora parontospora subsp. antibiotica]GII19941.1 hypothetical protein Ppa05_66670 [Planomonospora parontospora subsp. antibiotica]
MSRPRRSESGIRAHLIGAVIVSALAWWLLALTSLPALAAAWLAGAVAGMAAVSVLAAAGRAASSVLSQSAPRSRRSPRGAR